MLKWLVIGVGDITTKRVLPAILSEPRSALAGIVTRDPQKAGRYGVPGWTGLADALAQAEADVVYVATPVFLHASQSIFCLRAGKHVLCEKPMAMDYPEACRMQEAAVQAGRTLGIAYYRRMYPKVSRASELIEAGAIGRPVFAEATAHDWYCPADREAAWRIHAKYAGGGPLYDIASHRIDLMNYLFGKPELASGHISTLVHPFPVEDNATVLIDYESGVRGVVDVRWHSRVIRDEFRVRGTEGEIDLTPLNGSSLVYPGGHEEVPPPGNLHFPCIGNFVSAVLDQAPLRSSGASASLTDWVTDQVMAARGRSSFTADDKL